MGRATESRSTVAVIWNSPAIPERSANFADKELRLGVTGVMNFHALGQETFPTTLTAPREGGATALRAHARAKTVLIFPGALRALECAFHDVGR
jgi:hypothetical protein